MRKIIFLLIFSLTFFGEILLAKEILQEITVQPGDTLWSIANKYLKDPKRWNEIVNYNELPTSDPTLALPGTKIKVPIQLIKEEFRNAELIKLIPDVKVKPKNDSDWQVAKINMTLNYEDSLRTLKGGQAQVKFPSREVVQINENSYVVLRPEKILQEIQLLEGDIRASRAKVIMPHGTIVKPKTFNSDYQAKVREDDSEVVFVYKGKVDVTAKGKTVTVQEGYGTEVPKFSAPDNPKPLPNFPDFNPAALTSEVPTVNKSSEGKEGEIKIEAPKIEDPLQKKDSKAKSMMSEKILANYHAQISSTEKFEKIVFEETRATGKVFDIKKKPISDGTYYMRVAFIDALGTLGTYSAPTKIVKDTAPPVFRSLTPEDGKQIREEGYCDLVGVVEGASYLSVDDEIIFISSSGEFSKFLTLHDGLNIIRIVARDTAGNETIIERKVYFSP